VQGLFSEGGIGPLPDTLKTTLYDQAAANGGAYTLRMNQDTMRELLQPDAPPDMGAGEGKPGGGRYNDGPPDMFGRQSEMIVHVKLLNTAAGEEQMLLVSAAITPVNATVATLRVQLVWISVIVVALAIVIALLIARRVAKPIEKLNTAAKQLARGHYAVRFDGTGYREVSELSATLNHAAVELGKTEELQRELIANVSHDLRTPLTLITGYAEMVRDLPGEGTPENMQVIIDEAKRLTSLVNDLLDLSRLQSGTSAANPERFDLTQEIAEVIARFSKFSAPEGVTVAFEHDADGVVVQADRARIVQVIYNFLINAMTHGGDDKRITVRQQVADGRVFVRVIDTGAGIAPDQLPYIWDRYYKVDKVHRRAATGTGLGLSIVKHILEQHPDIQYGVDSGVGQGSQFWFSLPVQGAGGAT